MPINTQVRLCGAKAKQNNHNPCTQPAMMNKTRCRLHGGKSTGPKTLEGRERISNANLKHGLYTKEAIRERLIMRSIMQWKGDFNDF